MIRLFIRPEAPAQRDADGMAYLASASWVALDSDGGVRSQGSGSPAPLADLAGSPALSDPANVVVVVPAEFCLSVRCTPPAGGVGQIRRALPYLVEEYLASDLDDVHIASGPIRRQTPVDVAAIDKATLRGWVDALRALGLVPGHAIADAALLPTGDAHLSVLFEDRRALLRTPGQWLAVESDSIVVAIASALEEMDPDRDVVIEVWNGDVAGIHRAELEQGRAGRIEWRVEESDVPALVHLARTFSATNVAVDLLTGEFAPPRRRNESIARWRSVAALAGIWLALGLVATAAKGLWADARADALAEQAQALYREYFPNDRRVQDVYRQMSAHLGSRVAGEGDVLALIGELAQVAAPDKGTQVRSLAFNAERAELSAEVSVKGFDDLDRIKTTLNGRGLEVDVTSAEQQDQGVLARLRIRGIS